MRTVQTMIEQEVRYCLSGLVSTLASGNSEIRGSHGSDLANLSDQAFELASPVLDYEEAAREAGWSPDADGIWRHKDRPEWSDGSGELCYDTFEELRRFQDCIEPNEREVFEHWAVTEWFAEKLKAAGEKVDQDFAGMCVWARTTSGQAIYADAVIERIYADTQRAADHLDEIAR